MSNTDALNRFMDIVTEIKAVLAGIDEAAEEHFDVVPEQVNWANVGDAQRTLDGLTEILKTIRGENQ